MVVVDIASDGDLDIIIPLNNSYPTGIDTRHHFIVIENIDGTLESAAEKTNSTPFVTRARRLETF
ncbi:MAG: hypothetical protein P8H03_12040, partial [Emcibacteraceae bacterium]|nr:hypothetical protein [Emcibacteraceae bacterium]